MRILLKQCLLPLFSVGALLINNAHADPETLNTLPLSTKEISKLQHLVSMSSKAMPDFQVQSAHEHVVWQQAPINVVLPVGKERMVSFPTTVSFGYDKNILGDNVLSVQNNNGTLYLTAKAPFTTQRVEVKCQNHGQIILLNLSAQANGNNTPLDVVMAQPDNSATLPASNTTANTVNTNNIANEATPSFANDTLSYVELTRFAAQQLYAPKRLLVQPLSIYRTPMHTAKSVPLFLDGSVAAMPLASWRNGNLTVTAVLLRNQLHQPNTLDARHLCGSWQTASFFPQTVLAPAGQHQDSTTVFLVANQAFSDAMQTCLRGY